jgi:DNA-binding NarL/FixJ family response regulator
MVEPRKKILCIEDDRETAELVIVEELTDRGFEPIVAYDGHEGFVVIPKHRPDLILCDINMPIMSGFAVLEQLMEIAPRFGHIPFVFLTAMADRENELCAQAPSVAKPIDFDVLHAIINARLASVARNEIWPTVTLLNDREIEMLTWVARGKTSAQIAKITDLAKRTVDFHLDNALEKLGAATRTGRPVDAVRRQLQGRPGRWGSGLVGHRSEGCRRFCRGIIFMASASAPDWVRLALAWPVLNRQIGPPPYTLRTMTPQVISGTLDGSPAEMVEAKAKDLATKHLARLAAGTAAKKAAKSAAPTIVKSKPASAPPSAPPPETPKQLRDLVRASLLRRRA